MTNLVKEKARVDSKKIEKKLRLASDLFEMAFQMKLFCLKKQQPDLTEKELIRQVYALIERGCA